MAIRLAVVLLCVASVKGKTWIVDTIGSTDCNVSPLALQPAIDCSKAGDTLSLTSGEYRVTTTFNITKPISLIGETDLVVFDCQDGPGPVFRFNATAPESSANLSSVVLQNCKTTLSAPSALEVVGSGNSPLFTNVTIKYCAYAVLLQEHTAAVFQGLELINSPSVYKPTFVNGVYTTGCCLTTGSCRGVQGRSSLQINDFATVHFERSTFTNNSACYGGAVLSFHAAVTFTDCKFTRNSAWRGGAVNIADGSATFTDTQLFLNSAFGEIGGGALYVEQADVSLSQCELIANTVDTNIGHGGALSAWSSKLTVDQSNFTGNSARIAGAIDLVNMHRYSLTRTNFTFNVAASAAAVDIIVENQAYAERLKVAVVDSCRFENNSILVWTTDTGNLDALSHVGYAVAVGMPVGSGGVVNFTDSIFFGNPGGALTLHQYYNYGVSDDTVTAAIALRNCQFTANRCLVGHSKNRQAVLNLRGRFTPAIQDTHFIDNTCSQGAVVTVLDLNNPQFSGCTFENNVATDNRGAGAVLLHPDVSGSFVDCLFLRNRATCGAAGAVCATRGS